MLNGNGLVAFVDGKPHHTECKPRATDVHVLADLANDDPAWVHEDCRSCRTALADAPNANPHAVEYGREWLDRGMSLDDATDMAMLMAGALS